MFTSRETHLVVLHDIEDVRRALQDALRDAPPDQVLGLQRALAVVDDAGRDSAGLRARWLRRVLADHGVDPVDQEVQAIATLRKAVPGLGLAAATSLAREAREDVGRPGVASR